MASDMPEPCKFGQVTRHEPCVFPSLCSFLYFVKKLFAPKREKPLKTTTTTKNLQLFCEARMCLETVWVVLVRRTVVRTRTIPCGRHARSSTSAWCVQSPRKHGALRPQNPLRLIRDGEVWGGSGILYLTPTRYTVTTRMILH